MTFLTLSVVPPYFYTAFLRKSVAHVCIFLGGVYIKTNTEEVNIKYNYPLIIDIPNYLKHRCIYQISCRTSQVMTPQFDYKQCPVNFNLPQQ